MNVIVKEVLTKASILALENWGMMMIDPCEIEENLFPDDEHLYLTAMQFQGVMSGSIAILATQGFAETLCRNLLGREPQETIEPKECEDALQELTNVLSGNFLTEAYGDDTVFDLVYPTIRKLTFDNKSHVLHNKLTLCFMADDNPVAISVGPIGFVD